jgi:hypothetical protein
LVPTGVAASFAVVTIGIIGTIPGCRSVLVESSPLFIILAPAPLQTNNKRHGFPYV